MPLHTETFAHVIRGTGSIDTLPQCSRRMEQEEMGGKEGFVEGGRKEEGEVAGREDEVGGEQEGEGEEVGGCSEGG